MTSSPACQDLVAILPWGHLSSHLPAEVSRCLPVDWQRRYWIRPVLIESFCASERFSGVANWILSARHSPTSPRPFRGLKSCKACEPALRPALAELPGRPTYTGFAEEPSQILSTYCRRGPSLGDRAMLIPLLLPLLKRCYPHFAAAASGQPGRVLCKPHRRIS